MEDWQTDVNISEAILLPKYILANPDSGTILV